MNLQNLDVLLQIKNLRGGLAEPTRHDTGGFEQEPETRLPRIIVYYLQH
jgi:hypothetical protein